MEPRNIFTLDGITYLKGDYSEEEQAFEYFNMTDEMENGQSYSRCDLDGMELTEASKEEQDKVNTFLDNL